MLYIAKETIEDERYNLKYNDINQDYNKENTINNFTVKTWVTPMNNSKCYKLNVEVKNNYNEVELNTYVTKKKLRIHINNVTYDLFYSRFNMYYMLCFDFK